MNWKKANIVKLAIGSIVAALTVFAMVQMASLTTLSRLFRQVDYRYVAMGVLGYSFITALRALRFRLAGAGMPFLDTYLVAAAHSALVRVMPFRSGELSYGILTRSFGGSGFLDSMASLTMLRLLDLLVLLPLILALVSSSSLGLFSSESHWMLGISSLFLVALFFSVGPVAKALDRYSQTKSASRFWMRLGKLSGALLEAGSRPISIRLALFGLTILLWLSILAWLDMTLRASGFRFDLIDGMSVSVLATAGSVIPISLVGTFGPHESGFIAGLMAMGHNAEAAANGTLVVTTLTFATNWLLALPSLLVLFLKKRKSQRRM